MLKLRLAVVVFLLMGINSASAATPTNVDWGKASFEVCGLCHSVKAGWNGLGPSLHGLFGRTAGTAPGFHYSRAMKASGVVWNEETLDKYIENPHAFIPGVYMGYSGLKNATKRADLIMYLKQVTQ